jgi:hypothetical protein
VGKRLLTEFFLSSSKNTTEGKRISVDRGAIVICLLVPNHLDVFKPEVLLKKYHWGFPERFLSMAARHKPPAQ